ncbi:thialysine N-epsilon-acetyltransferase isoform X4 [Condylostylus longicornis]|uniref:thialysine N-epsilon-acetyltransferase isoform X4 n=1 Tax=Condylostylus longicornis TaxID=2530218 RepID=UPI00244DEBD3|nr:thialysine N-epsilon-acetyltransferase isoform X4 [Condylostylus longicornis]
MELAEFQGMPDGPKISTEELIKDSGLNDKNQHQYFHSYIVEKINYNSMTIPMESESSDMKLKRPLTQSVAIGYALCFFSYSTWQGKSYFIEDIYIRPEYRKKGIGRLLLKEICKNAKNYECLRVDFHVLEWNPSREFYEKMGAINLTKLEKWNFYRLDAKTIDKIIEEN